MTHGLLIALHLLPVLSSLEVKINEETFLLRRLAILGVCSALLEIRQFKEEFSRRDAKAQRRRVYNLLFLNKKISLRLCGSARLFLKKSMRYSLLGSILIGGFFCLGCSETTPGYPESAEDPRPLCSTLEPDYSSLFSTSPQACTDTCPGDYFCPTEGYAQGICLHSAAHESLCRCDSDEDCELLLEFINTIQPKQYTQVRCSTGRLCVNVLY